MQATETDNKNPKGRVDDELINFRPSPNFKHMKKYLKSKFEEAASLNAAANGIVETDSVKIEAPKVKKINISKVVMQQPPLPPNPPPPDSPPRIALKKEIEDDEYQTNLNNDSSEMNQSEELITEYKTDELEPSNDKPKQSMCRNFIRGTCTRGSSCIFSHELDLSQLRGVYTFCRNFQNRVCTLPTCKFVHATVFEKEYFYRTGYLPPHTLSHLKEANTLQLPPPPPPPPEEVQTEAPPVFSNPPPPLSLHPGVAPIPVMTCAPNPNIEPRTDVFRSAVSGSSPLKREWNEVEDFSSCSPRDLESTESLVKKCKHCENNEFRLQYNKTKVEKMKRSREEIDKKMAQLFKQNKKLYTILLMLSKPLTKAKPSGSPIKTTMNDGLEKTLKEQLHNYLNKRQSFKNEDSSNKNLLGGNLNISTLITNLLLNSGDLTASPDAS